MSHRALSAIQHHFHALIRRRAAEFGAQATGQLPSIQTLTQGGPDEWFEVPEKHGGFAYRLTTRSGDWVLHVESWNRFVGGSEETHEITESGVVLIGRHNPADDYSFSSEMPAPTTATSSPEPRSVPAIPEYIRERICRLVPDGVPVVPGSTPVVANLAVEFQPVGEGPGGRMKLYQGRYDDRLTVIGWNLNLQSSFGVSNAEMDALGAALRSLIGPP